MYSVCTADNQVPNPIVSHNPLKVDLMKIRFYIIKFHKFAKDLIVLKKNSVDKNCYHFTFN